jgi:hypothetical protein
MCAIVGPGGSFNLGTGAGVAEEGITVTMVEDKATMTVGADGFVMYSLHAGKSGTFTIRLQKTSPTNQMLAQLYAAQSVTSALYGQNTITINDPVRGDNITGQQCGFSRLPTVTYAKEGGMIEWAFHVGVVDMVLGSGNLLQ